MVTLDPDERFLPAYLPDNKAIFLRLLELNTQCHFGYIGHFDFINNLQAFSAQSTWCYPDRAGIRDWVNFKGASGGGLNGPARQGADEQFAYQRVRIRSYAKQKLIT